MHGSIHRDLKSPNVLLTFENGRRLRAKVADFGLAKTLRRERRRSSANSSSPISSPDIALSPTGRARAPKTKRRSTFFSALRKKSSATLAHVTTKGATVKRHRSSPIQRAKESLDEMQISRSTSGDKNRKARSKQSVFSQADSPAMMMTGLMGTVRKHMKCHLSSLSFTNTHVLTNIRIHAPHTHARSVSMDGAGSVLNNRPRFIRPADVHKSGGRFFVCDDHVRGTRAALAVVSRESSLCERNFVRHRERKTTCDKEQIQERARWLRKADARMLVSRSKRTSAVQ